MKVTFKCKRSGNTVSFTDENDIKQMRCHESYTEVVNETENIAEAVIVESKEIVIDNRCETKSDAKDAEVVSKEPQKGNVLSRLVQSAKPKRGRPAKK